jgi:hypothetical protein
VFKPSSRFPANIARAPTNGGRKLVCNGDTIGTWITKRLCVRRWRWLEPVLRRAKSQLARF